MIKTTNQLPVLGYKPVADVEQLYSASEFNTIFMKAELLPVSSKFNTLTLAHLLLRHGMLHAAVVSSLLLPVKSMVRNVEWTCKIKKYMQDIGALLTEH